MTKQILDQIEIIARQQLETLENLNRIVSEMNKMAETQNRLLEIQDNIAKSVLATSKAEPKVELPDIYRQSESFDEYMEKAIKAGYEKDLASDIYDELNWKYQE